jgi:hypothetical protein
MCGAWAATVFFKASTSAFSFSVSRSFMVFEIKFYASQAAYRPKLNRSHRKSSAERQ